MVGSKPARGFRVTPNGPRQHTGRLVLLLLAALLLSQLSAAAQVKTVRRVLIFNDLGTIASPGIALMDQAINAGLQDSQYQIELYSESLETTLFSDEVSQRQLRDWYIRKYEGRQPDVIIAVGPASLKFMIESHERSFPNIPVIFCGGTQKMLGELNLDSHFTGAWGVADPEETLNVALRLQPRTRNVVVVGGAGTFDRDVVNIVKESLRNYESKLNFTYLTDLDMPTILDRLRQLPSNTIVLHTSIMQDAAGTRFIDATQSLPMVAKEANAPVFVLDDVDVGNGAVGGYVLSWAAQGRVASQMAVRVLNGESPETIPIAKTPNVYLFDREALQRWGLDERDLPLGNTLLNRQTSGRESYKWYVIGGVSLILAEALLILEMLWLRARRKKVESALAKSEERFSKAFRQSPLSITLASAKDSRYIDVNKTFEQVTGWSRKEVIGRTPFEVGLWDDPEAKVAIAKRLLLGDVVRNLELKMRTKSGESRTNLVSAELIEIDGELCVLAVKADITDLKRAEASLRESEERFRLVANTAPVMIWMSATDKLCTYFNRPWLEFSGRSLEQELGNGWTAGIHPEDVSRCLDTYTNAFDRRETFQMEYRFRRGDGEYRWIIDSGVPRFNADGSFAGYIGSAIDITERKLASEALSMVSRKLIEAHEEERAWLARELHDDINQRLSLLAMNLGELKNRTNASLVRFKEGIGQAVQQVTNLAIDLQALSHRLHSSKLEFLGLAAAVAGLCSELADQHRVDIDLHAEDIPRDLSREIALSIFRVLQEALQNAIKHSGSRRFEVSLSRTSNNIILTVHDSGRGFDAVEAMKGRGLGLTSMKERVNLVAGELTIESKPQKGTTIHVRVPLTPRAMSAR